MTRKGSADVASDIRRAIEAGEFRRFDRLPPSRRLAASFGVARNTLRDALSRLEAEGLLETRAGSGTYVTSVSGDPVAEGMEQTSPLELMDARFALEPHICRLCVLHGRREDFDDLERLCDRMNVPGADAATFADADSAFHAALARATRNTLLTWLIGRFNTIRALEDWTLMTRLTLDAGIIGQYNRQHRDILDAIRARDPDRAAARMKEHLETARLSLTRALET